MPKANEGARDFDLPESMDSGAATTLAENIRAQRGAPLTLHAAHVKRLGGLCAQVLVSAGRSWRKDGVAIAIADPSPEFTRNLATLGLSIDHIANGEAR